MNNRDSTPITPIVIEEPIRHDKLGWEVELAVVMERISHRHGQALVGSFVCPMENCSLERHY